MAVPDGGRSVLDLLRELGASLRMRFGEVTVRFEEGEPVLLRQGTTLKPEALEQLAVVPGPPAG